MHKKVSDISGLGFIEALTILFIAYKLAGLITWSWLWVLSPLRYQCVRSLRLSL